jgi:hypothetical protein
MDERAALGEYPLGQEPGMTGMSAQWFYVEAGQSKGPFTQQDLLAQIQRAPSPADVQVWRNGQAGWLRAGDVAELNLQGARPAPAHHAVHHAQPSSSGGVVLTPRKPGSALPYVIGAGAIVAVLIGAGIFGAQRFQQADTRPQTQPQRQTQNDPQNRNQPQNRQQQNQNTQRINRTEFITNATRACADEQQKKTENRQLSRRQLENFCSCVVNGVVRRLSDEDLIRLDMRQTAGPHQRIIDEVARTCRT